MFGYALQTVILLIDINNSIRCIENIACATCFIFLFSFECDLLYGNGKRNFTKRQLACVLNFIWVFQRLCDDMKSNMPINQAEQYCYVVVVVAVAAIVAIDN